MQRPHERYPDPTLHKDVYNMTMMVLGDKNNMVILHMIFKTVTIERIVSGILRFTRFFIVNMIKQGT